MKIKQIPLSNFLIWKGEESALYSSTFSVNIDKQQVLQFNYSDVTSYCHLTHPILEDVVEIWRKATNLEFASFPFPMFKGATGNPCKIGIVLATTGDKYIVVVSTDEPTRGTHVMFLEELWLVMNR